MTKAKTDDEVSPELEKVCADVAALKRDLAAALAHLKSGTINGTPSLADQLADTAAGLSGDIAALRDRGVKSLGEHIEKQPLISVLIAFATGLLVSRIISR